MPTPAQIAALRLPLSSLVARLERDRPGAGTDFHAAVAAIAKMAIDDHADALDAGEPDTSPFADWEDFPTTPAEIAEACPLEIALVYLNAIA